MNSTNYTTAKPTTPEPFVMRRKIGSTLYKVGFHFAPDAGETLDDKIVRLLKNDLQSSQRQANMEPLQADWLPERKIA